MRDALKGLFILYIIISLMLVALFFAFFIASVRYAATLPPLEAVYYWLTLLLSALAWLVIMGLAGLLINGHS